MKRRKREKFGDPVPLEKSRKIIFLERRGRKLGGQAMGAVFLGILGVISILYCVGIALYGHGTNFFLIWGAAGAASLLMSFLLANKRLLQAIPAWVKKIFIVLICMGLVLFCAVEALIFTEYNANAKAGADYLVVLGAQWKQNGPGEMLRHRLDRAVEYLTENPDTKVIVSGGRGANEPMAEAVGMREYLIAAGIAEERILVEDQSVNTYQNLIFSAEYLNRENDRVVIVTNNFHVFRAVKIAKKQGYGNVEGLAADSTPGLVPNNLLREFIGILKDFLVGNL